MGNIIDRAVKLSHLGIRRESLSEVETYYQETITLQI